jgi:hypothetical protein
VTDSNRVLHGAATSSQLFWSNGWQSSSFRSKGSSQFTISGLEDGEGVTTKTSFELISKNWPGYHISRAQKHGETQCTLGKRTEKTVIKFFAVKAAAAHSPANPFLHTAAAHSPATTALGDSGQAFFLDAQRECCDGSSHASEPLSQSVIGAAARARRRKNQEQGHGQGYSSANPFTHSPARSPRSPANPFTHSPESLHSPGNPFTHSPASPHSPANPFTHSPASRDLHSQGNPFTHSPASPHSPGNPLRLTLGRFWS